MSLQQQLPFILPALFKPCFHFLKQKSFIVLQVQRQRKMKQVNVIVFITYCSMYRNMTPCIVQAQGSDPCPWIPCLFIRFEGIKIETKVIAVDAFR